MSICRNASPLAIVLTTDLTSPFHGLSFFNDPFQEAIGGRVAIADAAAVPEPATLVLSFLGYLAALPAGASRLRRRRAITR